MVLVFFPSVFFWSSGLFKESRAMLLCFSVLSFVKVWQGKISEGVCSHLLTLCCEFTQYYLACFYAGCDHEFLVFRFFLFRFSRNEKIC